MYPKIMRNLEFYIKRTRVIRVKQKGDYKKVPLDLIRALKTEKGGIG